MKKGALSSKLAIGQLRLNPVTMFTDSKTLELIPARSKRAGVFIHQPPSIIDWAVLRGINYPASPPQRKPSWGTLQVAVRGGG